MLTTNDCTAALAVRHPSIPAGHWVRWAKRPSAIDPQATVYLFEVPGHRASACVVERGDVIVCATVFSIGRRRLPDSVPADWAYAINANSVLTVAPLACLHADGIAPHEHLDPPWPAGFEPGDDEPELCWTPLDQDPDAVAARLDAAGFLRAEELLGTPIDEAGRLTAEERAALLDLAGVGELVERAAAKMLSSTTHWLDRRPHHAHIPFG